MDREEYSDDHEFGDEALEELSKHLYKSPKSAIKEGVTNGLDQQGKDARIEITTNVGPDGDIWIEDYGTGIENLEKFKLGLSGSKIVGDRVSSYKIIDPDIGGNKGLGKYSLLMLSATKPRPIVEFYSNRPHVEGKYRAAGMKVTMTNKIKGGFKIEHMNDIEALPHAGVRVVIKNAIYTMLPRESALIKYLSEVYAIRIKRGAKIFFNGNQIHAPEGFQSKITDEFEMSDGTKVKGNLRHVDKAEANNVAIYVKNILVEYASFEHKVSGWVNYDYLTPTSSRESIEQDDRYRDFEDKLGKYLDANFEKSKQESETKIINEKEKLRILQDLLQYQNELLAGTYDPEGIEGKVTGGPEVKPKWAKKEGMDIVEGAGGADPVIGTGHGGHGGTGGGGITTGDGHGKGVEEGGPYDVLVKDPNDKARENRVNPKLKIDHASAGFKMPPSYMVDANTIMLNLTWPQSVRAAKATGNTDGRIAFGLAVASAVINYGVQKQNMTLDSAEYQKRFNDYVRRVVEGQQ